MITKIRCSSLVFNVFSFLFLSVISYGTVLASPDLTSTTLSFAVAGPSAANIVIDDAIKNQGDTDAGTFEVAYYLSNGDTSLFVPPDALICTRTVTGLAAGLSEPATTTCPRPVVAPGTYYVISVVDSGGTVAETNEGNNQRGSSNGVVIGPDLIPTSLSAALSGTNIVIDDALKNQGNVDVSALFDVSYYLSGDVIYNSGDTLICKRSLSGLAAGVSNPTTGTVTTTCSRPSVSPGSYYVIAVVDSGGTVAELDEGNNRLVTTNTLLIVSLVESLDPNCGKVGDVVKIFGSAFGATQGSSSVTFNGVTAIIRTWSNTEIQAYVPTGATTGPVRVTVNGVASSGEEFTVSDTCRPTNSGPTDYDITSFHVKGEVEDGESFGIELSVFNVNDRSDPGFTYEVIGKVKGSEFFRISGTAHDLLDNVSTTIPIPLTAPSPLDEDDCIEFIATVTDADPDVDEVKAAGTGDDDDEAKTCKNKDRFRFTSPNNAESIRIGTIVPIKFRLEDKATGLPISDATAYLWIAKVSDHQLPEVPATSGEGSVGDTGNQFRFDPGDPGILTDDVYVFNWDTAGLTTGTWRLRVDLGDGKPHRLIIKLKR